MTRAPAALALALALAACEAEPAAAPQLDAVILRPQDTIRFQAPGNLFRCDTTSDILAEAVRGPNGLLVWLQFRDSLVGDLSIIGVRDTITRPSAVVTVRYMHQSVPHTVGLDSGSVTVRDSGTTRRLVIAGTGLDVGFGVRAGVQATFAGLPVTPESTTSCARAP